jgi:hypothetical protein
MKFQTIVDKSQWPYSVQYSGLFVVILWGGTVIWEVGITRHRHEIGGGLRWLRIKHYHPSSKMWRHFWRWRLRVATWLGDNTLL